MRTGSRQRAYLRGARTDSFEIVTAPQRSTPAKVAGIVFRLRAEITTAAVLLVAWLWLTDSISPEWAGNRPRPDGRPVHRGDTVSTATATVGPGTRVVPGSAAAAAIHRRTARDDFDRWLSGLGPAAGCSHPVKLRGQRFEVEAATGRVLRSLDTTQLPDEVLYVPCGNRRSSVCPSCAETYRADTFHLVSAGLVGGKGVPLTVAKHPCVFFTGTAPTFGPVHSHHTNTRTGRPQPCHPRRRPETCPHGTVLDCRERHDADDPQRGRPLCLDCYDHDHQTVWNAYAGELWRRTTIRANRLVRDLQRRYGCLLRLSYTKVAEFQHRGVVHFHALVRLDGRDPLDPDAVLEPDNRLGSAHLAQLLRDAAAQTCFTTPPHPARPCGWEIGWGEQLDPRQVRLTVRDVDDTGEITTTAVAAYLAKYATKATETTGHTSARLTNETVRLFADPATHAGRLIASCWSLGYRPDDADPEQWAAWLRPATPLGAHARLRRPLLHQVPPLLHHPRRAAPRPPRLAPRALLCRPRTRRTGRRGHHPRRRLARRCRHRLAHQRRRHARQHRGRPSPRETADRPRGTHHAALTPTHPPRGQQRWNACCLPPRRLPTPCTSGAPASTSCSPRARSPR
jgi:hypothetical protein